MFETAQKSLSSFSRMRMKVPADGRIASVIRVLCKAGYVGSSDVMPRMAALHAFGRANGLPGLRSANCKTNRDDAIDIIASEVERRPNEQWIY